MKLASANNVIERSGDLNDEENFTIALTAKAIEVLSSQIYKDAHLAILRELGTNAADSHIEAGKRDLPFEVTLPNEMQPELIIRDYGTGMAYEKVMTMYRTYFGSDKTSNNEVTGCLGLGSKSPLAYTDQFNVTSWFNGEKSSYVIYKNERGLPAINRIFHEASDEPTGVEVRLSIKRHDFYLFKEKAKQVYRWFTPRPKVNGLQDADWPKDIINFQSDNWALRADTQQKMTIVMGNVAYHVEKSDLNPIISKLDRNGQVLANCAPILYVKIGDVDIAASRETLKFDGPKTLPTIKALLKKMGDEITKKFMDELDGCKTHWDARKHFKKLRNAAPLGSILPASAKWKDIDLEVRIPLRDYDKGVLVKDFASARKYFMKPAQRGYHQVVSSQQVNQIECEPGAELYIIDSKNHISRIGYYVRSGPKNDPYAIPSGEVRVLYILEEATGDDKHPEAEVYTLDQFLKENHLDGVIKKTRQQPDTPKNYSGFRSASYQMLTPIKGSSRSSHWAEKTVDFDKGGVYVEVFGNEWSAGTVKEWKAEKLFTFAPLIATDKIVGVRRRSLEDFQSSDLWTRLDQHIIDKYQNDQASKDAAALSALYSKVNSSYEYCSMACRLAEFKATRHDGLFGELCLLCSNLKKQSESDLAVNYMLAAPFLGINIINVDKEYDEVRRMFKEFDKRYPMLDLVDISDHNKKTIQHYVDLVDASVPRKTPQEKVRSAVLCV